MIKLYSSKSQKSRNTQKKTLFDKKSFVNLCVTVIIFSMLAGMLAFKPGFLFPDNVSAGAAFYDTECYCEILNEVPLVDNLTEHCDCDMDEPCECNIEEPCDEEPEKIISLVRHGIIDVIQLHGSEDETYIQKLKQTSSKPVIKAIGVNNKSDVPGQSV